MPHLSALMSLTPDLILTRGRITTMDAERPEVEALAIRGDQIIAVGSSEVIESLADDHTVIRDLAGRRAIPGINDTHNHVISMGRVLNDVQLYAARSISDIQEAIAAAVDAAPPGAWIFGRGWDESLLRDGRFPNRHDIDEVAPNNPVVLERVWNMLLANSAAMQAADVGRHTPDPPSGTLYAGRIERDANGDPTGIFRDRSKSLILSAMPQRTATDHEHAIRAACRAYNALGVTSCADPGLMPDQLQAYQNVRRAGDLTLRTSLCLAGWGFGSATEDDDDIAARIEATGVYTGFGDAWLRMDCVKFLPDGGIGDRTALMYESYLGEPDNFGQFVVSERDLFRYVSWCHDRGWSIDNHACGDRMIHLVAQAYAQAIDANPAIEVRHRIHHGYLITDEAMALLRDYRIPVLATIPFIYNLGESFVASIGEERAGQVMPLRSLLDAGVPLALGSDAPVTTYNPFVGIYAATTRRTVYGRQLGADECITREEALRAYTLDAAWVTREEDRKGSLAVGMLADIAVLDRDLFSVPDDELLEITSQLTIVGGRVAHETPGAVATMHREPTASAAD